MDQRSPQGPASVALQLSWAPQFNMAKRIYGFGVHDRGSSLVLMYIEMKERAWQVPKFISA